MSIEQGLHLESTYIGMDEIQAICSRRTFALLFITERGLAILRNKPTQISRLPHLSTEYFDDQDGTAQPPAPPAGGQGAQGVQGPPPAPVADMAILSHEYFEKRYGGNPDVLGHTMRTGDGSGLVIVGVLTAVTLSLAGGSGSDDRHIETHPAILKARVQQLRQFSHASQDIGVRSLAKTRRG